MRVYLLCCHPRQACRPGAGAYDTSGMWTLMEEPGQDFLRKGSLSHQGTYIKKLNPKPFKGAGFRRRDLA